MVGVNCFATGTRGGEPLACTLSAGHKTLLEHCDGNRGLRWLPAGNRVSAWPGSEADTWDFVARVDRSLGIR